MRENFLVDRQEIYGSHYLFFFFPTQLNTFQKKKFPIFSLKFSIHHISPSNKNIITQLRLGRKGNLWTIKNYMTRGLKKIKNKKPKFSGQGFLNYLG